MRSVASIEVPDCTLKLDKKKPPCGLPMFRLGTQAAWAWVCAVCDEVPVEKGLDA